MFFPVIDRELRLASRRRKTYGSRLILVSVGTAIFLLAIKVGESNPLVTGSYYFTIIQFILFLFCAMEGVRATSDCLSEEERQGTLGLLFLTRLTGFDVVMGKLVSSSLNSFYFLLGMLPLSGLALLLGGVSFQEYWKTNVVLVCFLFFCLSCGVFVSSRVLKEGTAGVYTVLLIACACFLPRAIQSNFLPASNLSRFSPFSLLWGNLTLLGNTGFSPNLWPLWGVLGFSMVLIGFASWRVGRLRSTLSSRRKESELKKTRGSRFSLLPGLRKKWLEKEPIVYLLLKDYRFIWFLTSLVLLNVFAMAVEIANPWMRFYSNGGWGSLSITIILGLLIFKTAAFFNSLRESGALELILTTPVSPHRIVRAVNTGINRTLGISILLVWMTMTIGSFSFADLSDNGMNLFQKYLEPALSFAGHYYSLKWLAMAFGITERKTVTAFFKTVGVGIVLPSILGVSSILLFGLREFYIQNILILVFPFLPCFWGFWRVRSTMARISALGIAGPRGGLELGKRLPVSRQTLTPRAPAVPPPVPPERADSNR